MNFGFLNTNLLMTLNAPLLICSCSGSGVILQYVFFLHMRIKVLLHILFLLLFFPPHGWF